MDQLPLFDPEQLPLACAGGHIKREEDLLGVALALNARCVPGWSEQETVLAGLARAAPNQLVDSIRSAILTGLDPLGDSFCRIRSAQQRRPVGATYTPHGIVAAMIEGLPSSRIPSRIIDPGTGTARFLVAAGRRYASAELMGVETDPLASILARANLAVHGLTDRSRVMLEDYRNSSVCAISGPTLYIGNPPYVRHHHINNEWKNWLLQEATKRDFSVSKLAGLHVYFFLKTAMHARAGDFGIFITSAEWLDVNYGSLVRDLVSRDLGGTRIVVIEPTALPFPDAATTAVICSFEVGTKTRSVSLSRVSNLTELHNPTAAHRVRRERLQSERRWSHLTRGVKKETEGFVELGELCRVHRGQVTGANRIWIAGKHSQGLPTSVLFHTVTRARELFEAGAVLDVSTVLRQVIDIPIDLDTLDRLDRRKVEQFLERARRMGAHESYIASNRKAWWSVGLREPAPILATYMARRPPAFVRNRAEARHINIAHGLYPRETLSEDQLSALANYLSKRTLISDGRTYAGGLTKFEPREMERLLVPTPDALEQFCA